MGYDPQGAADASGPNGSIEWGGVAENRRLANSLKDAAPGAYAATQPPQAQRMAPPPPMAGMPVQQQAPTVPTQPIRPPVTPYDASLAFPNLSEQQPWRQYLNTFASPDRPYLSFFADLANRDPGYRPTPIPPAAQ